MKKIYWTNLQNIPPRAFKCGHCGESLASEKGYTGQDNLHQKSYAWIYICHKCQRPTFFDYDSTQVPGPVIGNPVKFIPDKDVEDLFNEAKACFSISAFTSSVMCSKKLIMNIAVSEGAQEGQSFVEYVNFLYNNNYIPPKGREWVNSMRKLGDSANHKIYFKTQDEARRILNFVEMLLRFIYELPGIMKETENENEEVLR